MQLGLVGLGKMGLNIARRVLRQGHQVVGYDFDEGARAELEKSGGSAVSSLKELSAALERPAVVWVMLPHGQATESTITTLAGTLLANDIVIDGGNGHFRDDIRRERELSARGIRYLDVGTSGGVFGLERGFCLMVGGDRAAVLHLDPIFATLAPGAAVHGRTRGREGPYAPFEHGYIHAGPAGAGHFLKMVHNGIEYALMQAYAEGFAILEGRSSDQVREEERYNFDLAAVSELWRRGSVISSWLLDLSAEALTSDPSLNQFSSKVGDSGEGKWTVEAAMEQGTPASSIAEAVFSRYQSRQEEAFGNKLLSAMRFQFGGHKAP